MRVEKIEAFDYRSPGNIALMLLKYFVQERGRILLAHLFVVDLPPEEHGEVEFEIQRFFPNSQLSFKKIRTPKRAKYTVTEIVVRLDLPARKHWVEVIFN